MRMPWTATSSWSAASKTPTDQPIAHRFNVRHKKAKLKAWPFLRPLAASQKPAPCAPGRRGRDRRRKRKRARDRPALRSQAAPIPRPAQQSDAPNQAWGACGSSASFEHDSFSTSWRDRISLRFSAAAARMRFSGVSNFNWGTRVGLPLSSKATMVK